MMFVEMDYVVQGGEALLRISRMITSRSVYMVRR